MSETQRNPKVASMADLEALKAQLEEAEQTTNAVELLVTADNAAPAAEAAPLPVEAESAPVPGETARLGYDDAIARREEIKTYLDPIFAARTILSERDDIEKGTFRREWFKTAKQMLVDAGYPVDGKLRQGDFFAIVAALQAEDRALKDQTAAERAERKTRAPRERATPAKTAKPDRRQAKPSAPGQKHVSQGQLDNFESRTRVWEIDSDEDDIIARERLRRAASRAATAAPAAVLPAVVAPSAHLAPPTPEAFGPDASSASTHLTPTLPEEFGSGVSEPGGSARLVPPAPEAFGPDADDLDIFGTAHLTPPLPEAYGPDTEHGMELDATITDARNRYARLTAKDRTSYFGRFLQSDTGFTKFLRRIPGVARIADNINARQSRDKDAAQTEYEALINGISGEITAETVEQQLAHRKVWMINESLALEQAVADYAKESSKDAGVFTNWWMSQEEGKLFSKVKKAAVIAVGSAAVAAGATIFLPSMMFGLATGAVVGGVTGGYMAHRVTKRRNNADIKVGRNATMSHADYDAAYSMNDQFDAISGSGATSAATITGIVESKSDAEMLRNRKRAGSAKFIGSAAGGLTGLGVGRLHELWDSHSQAATDAQSAVEKADTARQAAEEKAKALQEQLTQQANGGGAENGAADLGSGAGDANGGVEVLQGNSFTVENGSGFVKEWGQWADLNGHKIDGQTATDLHQAVLDKFGPDGVIDLKTLPTDAETYIQNGDLRIGAPGSAQ